MSWSMPVWLAWTSADRCWGSKDLLIIHSSGMLLTGGEYCVYLFLTVDVFLLAQARRTLSKRNWCWQTSLIRTSRSVFWTDYDTNLRFSFKKWEVRAGIATVTWIRLLWLQNPHNSNLHSAPLSLKVSQALMGLMLCPLNLSTWKPVKQHPLHRCLRGLVMRPNLSPQQPRVQVLKENTWQSDGRPSSPHLSEWKQLPSNPSLHPCVHPSF